MMITLIVLSVTGILILYLGLFKNKKLSFFTGLAGLLVSSIFIISDWGKNLSLFNQMLIIDNYSIAFNLSLIFITILIFLISFEYIKDFNKYIAEIYALMIFGLVGACLMTSFGNMATLFIGIETLSIPLYVLAGSRKTSIASNEASFKYYILGSFATAFFLLGIALIYGASGSFNNEQISNYIISNHNQLPKIFYTGIIMMIIGLSFKIAAVPFHFWSPDVYEGAPTLITAFMATIVKTAGFAALFRLLNNTFGFISSDWQIFLWIITFLTLIISNLAALQQTGMKRLMAYSGISNSGYILIAILAFNYMSPGAILLYTFTYSLATITIFGVIMIHKNQSGSDSIDSFIGFAKKNPFIGILMTISLFSLAGIPLTGGFFAKYYIFLSAINSHFIVLVVFAVICAVIAFFYYFKIISSIWKENNDQVSIQINPYFKTAFIVHN